MHKLTLALVPAAVLALPFLSGTLNAAEAEVVDMNSYLCKDLMRMDSEERRITLGVLHGYVLGKKGATSFVSDDLSKLSDQYIEYCLDNPQEKALPAFEKLAK